AEQPSLDLVDRDVRDERELAVLNEFRDALAPLAARPRALVGAARMGEPFLEGGVDVERGLYRILGDVEARGLRHAHSIGQDLARRVVVRPLRVVQREAARADYREAAAQLGEAGLGLVLVRVLPLPPAKL